MLKGLLGRQMRGEHLARTFQLTKDLKFPKIVLTKMMEQFVGITASEVDRNNELRVPLAHMQKIVLIGLEDPLVPVPLCRSLVDKVLADHANSLETLTLLYYISRVLSSCLFRKVEQQCARNEAR